MKVQAAARLAGTQPHRVGGAPVQQVEVVVVHQVGGVKDAVGLLGHGTEGLLHLGPVVGGVQRGHGVLKALGGSRRLLLEGQDAGRAVLAEVGGQLLLVLELHRGVWGKGKGWRSSGRQQCHTPPSRPSKFAARQQQPGCRPNWDFHKSDLTLVGDRASMFSTSRASRETLKLATSRLLALRLGMKRSICRQERVGNGVRSVRRHRDS